MSVERFYEHELSRECDWCHGTGVGSDESGRCYNPGCGSSGTIEYFEDRKELPVGAVLDESVVSRAEVLGEEAQRRLERWGAKPCTRSSIAHKSFTVQSVFMPDAIRKLATELGGEPVRSFDGELARLSKLFAARFPELPDPMEPMKEIWALGFALTECSERMRLWAHVTS